MDEQTLINAMNHLNLKPKRSGRSWVCRCPAHDDQMPSLSAKIAPNGRLLLYCHAGCPFNLILSALGLKGSDCFVPNTPTEIREKLFNPLAWRAVVDTAVAEKLAASEDGMRLPFGSLARIGCVWAMAAAAIAAPMFDASGNVCGIRYRDDTGKKWAERGSHNGLFMPREFNGCGPLFLPEGMTDTAAMVGLGFDAIGRPSCNTGANLVRAFVRGPSLKRPIIVVADQDRAGIDGAEALRRGLALDGADVSVMTPPARFKDVRDWVAAGATRNDVAFVVRNVVQREAAPANGAAR